MSKSSQPTVLICGDAGAARYALLARPELKVLWADTAVEALAMVRHERPHFCVTRAMLGDGGAERLLRGLCELGGPPCLVLTAPHESKLDPLFIALGANVVEIGQAHAVLEMVCEYTGVRFATSTRAQIQTVVEVVLNGEKLVLETINISSTGLALRGLPPLEVGSELEINFLRLGKPFKMRGMFVRSWEQEGESCGAVELIDVSPEHAAWIDRVITEQTNDLPRPKSDVEELFADIGQHDGESPLKTGDIGPTAAELAEFVDTEDPAIDQVRRVVGAMVSRDEIPLDLDPWVQPVAEMLTPLERGALLGQMVPRWAFWSINVRLKLARHRYDYPSLPLHPDLAERAYCFFQDLPTFAEPQDDQAAAEIGTIRASILRELLSRDTVARIDVPSSDEVPTVDLLRERDMILFEAPISYSAPAA